MQGVFNSPSFNPNAGCNNMTYCDGKGGMFVVLEVPLNSCSNKQPDSASYSCNEGCIVGSVLGSIFGSLILGGVVYMLFFRWESITDVAGFIPTLSTIVVYKHVLA
jgi:hypothetical protein